MPFDRVHPLVQPGDTLFDPAGLPAQLEQPADDDEDRGDDPGQLVGSHVEGGVALGELKIESNP